MVIHQFTQSKLCAPAGDLQQLPGTYLDADLAEQREIELAGWGGRTELPGSTPAGLPQLPLHSHMPLAPHGAPAHAAQTLEAHNPVRQAVAAVLSGVTHHGGHSLRPRVSSQQVKQEVGGDRSSAPAALQGQRLRPCQSASIRSDTDALQSSSVETAPAVGSRAMTRSQSAGPNGSSGTGAYITSAATAAYVSNSAAHKPSNSSSTRVAPAAASAVSVGAAAAVVPGVGRAGKAGGYDVEATALGYFKRSLSEKPRHSAVLTCTGSMRPPRVSQWCDCVRQLV